MKVSEHMQGLRALASLSLVLAVEGLEQRRLQPWPALLFLNVKDLEEGLPPVPDWPLLR